MNPADFEALVAQALDDLPEPFASHLDNVQVVVADRPSVDQLRSVDVAHGATLLGLYEGIPQTQRGMGYTFVLPDKITIFREPIVDICSDETEIREQVTITVIHEIAHHFGIDDERLHELGW